MKNQIAQKEATTMTPGQMKDLISAIIQGIPVNLPQGSKKKLLSEMRKVYASIIVNPYADMVIDWEQFYLKHFQKVCDFSALLIPDCPGENWRLLVVIDFLLEQLYAKCKEWFKCWRWTNDNLDKIVVRNERNAKSDAYAIWVKNEVEADENLKNLSARSIRDKNIETETLAERFIHELKFFTETGRHLDIKNVTLCTGSRYVSGYVPSIGWSSEVSVHWYNPSSYSDHLRSRQVVS